MFLHIFRQTFLFLVIVCVTHGQLFCGFPPTDANNVCKILDGLRENVTALQNDLRVLRPGVDQKIQTILSDLAVVKNIVVLADTSVKGLVSKLSGLEAQVQIQKSQLDELMKKFQNRTIVPLHRYYNDEIRDHFYTTSWAELGGGAKEYKYEGVAGYLFSPKALDITRSQKE